MFEGRFSFGVGTGEALNEHIFGDAWPTLDVRLEMLEEAVEVMRELWTGELSATGDALHGRHRPALHAARRAAAGAGLRLRPKATELAARIGEGYLNASPDGEMLQLYRDSGGTGPGHGGVKVCWAETEQEARETIHRLWPNEAIPGEAAQVLPSPHHFEQLAQLVTEDMVAEGKALGPDVERYVEAVKEYVDAGYDEVYLSQVGEDQEGFFRFWETELKPALDRL